MGRLSRVLTIETFLLLAFLWLIKGTTFGLLVSIPGPFRRHWVLTAVGVYLVTLAGFWLWRRRQRAPVSAPIDFGGETWVDGAIMLAVFVVAILPLIWQLPIGIWGFCRWERDQARRAARGRDPPNPNDKKGAES